MRLSQTEVELLEQRKQAELRYIAQLTRELRDMAQGRRDRMLTYLLEMAYLEASDRLRGRPDVDLLDDRRAA